MWGPTSCVCSPVLYRHGWCTQCALQCRCQAGSCPTLHSLASTLDWPQSQWQSGPGHNNTGAASDRTCYEQSLQTSRQLTVGGVPAGASGQEEAAPFSVIVISGGRDWTKHDESAAPSDSCSITWTLTGLSRVELIKLVVFYPNLHQLWRVVEGTCFIDYRELLQCSDVSCSRSWVRLQNWEPGYNGSCRD